MRKVFGAISLLLAVGLGFSLARNRNQGKSSSGNARRVLYYVDPMHPSYKSDRPGIAPDCGMQLAPVYADGPGEVMEGAAAPTAPGAVNIDLGAQQLFGIRVATVEKTSATRTLRIPGKITADETRLYPIKAGVDGFVKETQEDKVGSHVKKDQRLAYIYSPEFLSAATAYLAVGGGTQGGTGKEEAAGTQNVSAAQNWANRLRTLGISDVQIKELDSTHTVPEYMYVVSPVDGFILARNTFSGLRFEKNMEFYRIADLSHVWIIADLFESDRYNFRPGAVARITLLDQQTRLSARVSDILPEADTTTHTLKLRLETENRNLALRPGMLVDVELTVQARPGLSVPDDAVLDSGLSKHVFVERGNGNFELRQVETGEHFGDRVQILGGLAQGDRVVVSGTFLVDSESRLRSLMSAPSGAPMSGAKSDHMHDHTAEAQPGAGHTQ